MLQFFETRMGQKFYSADIPRLVKAVEEQTKEQKKTNELLEQLLRRMDAEEQETPSVEFDPLDR